MQYVSSDEYDNLVQLLEQRRAVKAHTLQQMRAALSLADKLNIKKRGDCQIVDLNKQIDAILDLR